MLQKMCKNALITRHLRHQDMHPSDVDPPPNHYKKSCILLGNNARSKNSWKIFQELCQGKLLANLPGATPHKSSGKMYGGI